MKSGRFVIDEPADLDAEESAALDAAIDEGLAQADRGEAISADELARRLRT